MRKIAYYSVLLAAVSSSAASAQIAPIERKLSEAVSYADLNLHSREGLAELDRRIGIAIRRVCGKAGVRDFAATEDLRKCRADVLAQVAGLRAAVIAGARQSGAEIRVAVRAR